MAKPVLRRTFIRKWREKRGLSLRQLEARMEEAPGGKTVSHATIGRIETGAQPYSQEIIEGLAWALGVDVVDLLTVDPTKEGEVVDLTRTINALDESRRAQAIEYLRFLARK